MAQIDWEFIESRNLG